MHLYGAIVRVYEGTERYQLDDSQTYLTLIMKLT